ncbi:hypothetical protein GDO81_021252 [Engystomops pustulosus]|uniref:Uncharacterized protein n=1 Tax=Engystomops pustulosus TaxID=76066 RepID=A0AAV6YP18_ENGPU|nr:hypothetical protein GDO81_021252 [Engystomops pustulosus]
MEGTICAPAFTLHYLTTCPRIICQGCTTCLPLCPRTLDLWQNQREASLVRLFQIVRSLGLCQRGARHWPGTKAPKETCNNTRHMLYHQLHPNYRQQHHRQLSGVSIDRYTAAFIQNQRHP